MSRLYITLILVLAAVLMAGFVFWRYFYLATVRIDPIPTDATITVNGQPSVERVLQLPKGSYEIKVSAPGYRSQTFTVNVGYGSQITKRVELTALPKPAKLIDGPIASLRPAPDKKEIFFEKSDILYRWPLPTDQPSIPVIPITPTVTDTESVDWSPDFALALVKKTTGETGLYDFNRYDLLHQEYRVLGSNIGSTAWSADGKNFLYEQLGAERGLIRANRAGSGQTRVLDLQTFPMSDLTLQTGPGALVVASSPSTASATDIVVIDTHQKTVGAITDSGRAKSPVLSPNKNLVAYLDNGELVTSEITGKNKRNHNIRPKAETFTFLDEVNVVVFTPNLVTVISTTDGQQQTYEIYAPSDEISHLFADPSGKILYYTYDGAFYQISFRP